MFPRVRIALGLALALILLTAVTTFAKGGFSFIAVTGRDLKGEVRLSDPALTQGFFAFADFYRDKTEAPADPGVGYEITRYYFDGKSETAFDKLHYYPDTGFVYYDGIVNGSSEYDGEWYIAVPEIRSTLETSLNTELRLVALGNPEVAEAIAREQAQISSQSEPPAAPAKSPPVVPIVLALGLAVILATVIWLRKPMFQRQPKGG